MPYLSRNARWVLAGALVVSISRSVDGEGAEPSPAIKSLYKKHCTSCHADDGRGKASKAKMLKIEPKLLDLTRPSNDQYTRDDLRRILVEGKDEMPSFKSKLKPATVEPMLEYTLVLMKREKK